MSGSSLKWSLPCFKEKFWIFGQCLLFSSSLRVVCSKTFQPFKDQNFDRQTWMKTSPRLLPCLLPHGKYVVTQRWSLLTGKDSQIQMHFCSLYLKFN